MDCGVLWEKDWLPTQVCEGQAQRLLSGFGSLDLQIVLFINPHTFYFRKTGNCYKWE